MVPAITNGWTLLFSFPNGQRLQNGWPVSFTQPANSAQVTVASNAQWNQSIGSGQSFTAGFNGTFSGTNNAPTAFTLNGTACNGGTTPPQNTPPTVSLTSPTSGQQFNQGASVSLAANASDNSGVSRVEFRVDGRAGQHRHLVAVQLQPPRRWPLGSHTAQATAFDNANPPLSAATALIPFSIVAVPMGATIIANPTTVNITGSATGTATGTSNVRLSAAPTGTVTVTLTRTGSTAITSSPGTISFTSANWQAGVNVTFTAAAGTTAVTSTFAAAAPNYTGASITVNRTATGPIRRDRVDNPYAGATVYNNSSVAGERRGRWRQRHREPAHGCVVRPHQRHRRQQQPDHGQHGAGRSPERSRHPGRRPTAPRALVFQMVVYNLPGRDCAALASNGELGPERPAALPERVHQPDPRHPAAA